MKYFKFLIVFSLTWALVWALNRPWLIGNEDKKIQLPRFGMLLSPSTGFWQNAESKSLPPLPGSLSIKGLSAPVTIEYDAQMVPHIFASNSKDAFFAQGYITAFFRLWQMEFQTHAAAGRISEIIGHINPGAIEFDRAKRRSGLPWAAKRAVEEWKKQPEQYALLESYAEGVNAYIASLSSSSYPVEYKILGYQPEPWSVLKTALLLKSMAETLSEKDLDLEMTNAYALLGRENFQKLYPEYFPEQSPIVRDSAWVAGIPPQAPQPYVQPFLGKNEADTAAAPVLVPGKQQPPKGIGSNNWAVGGSRTASGKPILCNDPHLNLTLPSIWFIIQLHTPEYNAYGATLPGAPGVIIGFNEHAAWGTTNVGQDVRDWYAIEWRDATKTQYMFDGNYLQAEHVFDTIRVRGQEKPFIDTLIFTHIGPVAYSHKGYDLCLRWAAHDPSFEPATFLKFMKAKSYEDYIDALQHFACPAQNLLFATKNGDIAISTQGKLPLRRPWQGRFVQDGSRSSEQWNRYIPQEHIPHEHNPARGFVGSANQHSVNWNYPYYYYGYFEEFRGRRLNEQLAGMQKVGTKEMMALQYDRFSLRAQDFLPLFFKNIQRGLLNKDELEVLNELQTWDYVFLPESHLPTVFDEWMRQFKAYLYDEIDSLNRREGFPDREALVYPDEWHILNVFKRDTAQFVIDHLATPTVKETLREVVTESFKKTCEALPKTEGKTAPWGRVQAIQIQHLARLAPFSVSGIEMGGDGSALNAMTSRYLPRQSQESGELRHRNAPASGPSWRMIVELGDSPTAYGIYPGGQSGNPGSAFYSDMIEKWAKGEYHQLLFLTAPGQAPDKILHSSVWSPK